ncbi:MAG: deoxyribonuclease [Candidatus Sedimenticola sp. (ex Thyasira tokunagai)]
MTTDSPKLQKDFSSNEKAQGNGRIRTALLLTAIAAVGYFIYTEQSQTPPAVQDNRSEIAPIDRTARVGANVPGDKKAMGEPRTVESRQPAQASAGIIENLPDGEAARTLIAAARSGQGAIDYEALYRKANLFQQQEKHTDAFLLYFFSAREGHHRSALKLGEMNDPAHFTGEGDLLQRADPTQAYKWYRRAAEGGLTEAQQRLSVLRSTTESAATSGNAKAQRLLLNWK